MVRDEGVLFNIFFDCYGRRVYILLWANDYSNKFGKLRVIFIVNAVIVNSFHLESTVAVISYSTTTSSSPSATSMTLVILILVLFELDFDFVHYFNIVLFLEFVSKIFAWWKLVRNIDPGIHT